MCPYLAHRPLRIVFGIDKVKPLGIGNSKASLIGYLLRLSGIFYIHCIGFSFFIYFGEFDTQHIILIAIGKGLLLALVVKGYLMDKHSLGIKDKAIRGIEERSGCEPFFPAKGLIREIEIYLELGVL